MAVITNHFFCLQKETRASVLKVHNKLINTYPGSNSLLSSHSIVNVLVNEVIT